MGVEEHNQLNTYKELVSWLALYNKILGEEVAELVPYAVKQGWVSKRHAPGKKCRERISELTQKLKDDKNNTKFSLLKRNPKTN